MNSYRVSLRRPDSTTYNKTFICSNGYQPTTGAIALAFAKLEADEGITEAQATFMACVLGDENIILPA